MNIFLIFAIIWGAMIANSFWEVSVEGREAGNRGKDGWKFHLLGWWITQYHFFLFWIMWPLLLSLPLVVYGWNLRLFGILVSAYVTGLVIEDFVWFLVNPRVGLRYFNRRFVNYYPWFRIGRIDIPVFYVVWFLVSFASWYFIWR